MTTTTHIPVYTHMVLTDRRGILFTVGDPVAFARREGNTAGVYYGVVTSTVAGVCHILTENGRTITRTPTGVLVLKEGVDNDVE